MDKFDNSIAIHCSYTELADTIALVPNPRNPNQHPQKQIELLAKIIKVQGWRTPITVSNRSGFIVRGHGRLLAAQLLGVEQVPIDRQDYATEAEEWADLIADNRIAELAEVNDVLLSELLADINGLDMELTGFNEEELNGLLSSLSLEQDVDETNETAPSLAERFLIPPFSVIDARKKEWQDRKRAWLEMGVRSEASREDTKTTGSLSGTIPGYYDKKKSCEIKLGRELTHNEFQEGYLKDYLPKNSLIATTNDGGMLSIFDPVLCELLYYWFCPSGGCILDPFAGGSVRGIVASLLGYKYTGIDIRSEQVEANIEQSKSVLHTNLPTWIVGDSQDITSLAPGEYDFIFSCPPYADLEVYSDNPADLSTMEYDVFVKAYRNIILNAVSMLKEDRFACFVVGDIRDRRGFYRSFVGDTITAFIDAGMMLYNEAVLLTALGSLPIRVGKQFSYYRKLGKAHQNVLVFFKGNPKSIKNTYGQVEIDESLFSLQVS